MKLILRFLSCILCLALLMPLAVSCHGRLYFLEEFRIDENFDENEQIEISFWAKNDNNPTQIEIYKKAIADFEALYPNIKVKFKPYSDYGLIYRDVTTNLRTNTTPNICISYPDHIATYMQGTNVMVRLDDLMRDDRYGFGGSDLKFESVKKVEIVEKFLDEGRIADGYYAMPFMRSTEACYINKDLVNKLGYDIPDILTWDFIWEVSEAAMKKNDDGTFAINGQSTMIPCIYKSTDNMMISMLKQKNAGYSTSAAEIEIFNDTTRELLYEIAEHSGAKDESAFSTFKIVSYPGNFFNAGQCIFAIDSTAGATWIGSNAPLIDIDKEELVDFETVVRPIPQYDADDPKMISQGPSICIFNKENTQEVLASWFFVQYLLTNEVQIAYAQTEGYVPVTTKAQLSSEYREYLMNAGIDNDLHYDVKVKATQLLLDNIDNTFVTPVFAGSAGLRNAAGQLIEEIVYKKRTKGTVDDEFIDMVFDKVYTANRLNDVKPVEIDTETQADTVTDTAGKE